MEPRKLAKMAALAMTLSMLLLVAAVVYAQNGEISGVVYCDKDYDYSLDPGEEVGGVTVSLWDDAGCDNVPDGMATTMDTLADGTYAFTGLDVGASFPGACYILEADANAPELGTCNFIPPWSNPQSRYLYEPNSPTATVDFPFMQIWEKLVNGQPWVPGMAVTAQTSDTIVIIDRFFSPFQGDQVDFGSPDQEGGAEVGERWDPSRLDLVDVEYPDWTKVISDVATGILSWTLPPPWDMLELTATLTKTFHVEPCTWVSTTLEEGLFWEVPGLQGEQPQAPVPSQQAYYRPVIVNKTAPDLFIDSTYNAEISPGGPANFTLSYGNNGGFENDVWIRNVFPPEALFSSADPPPDSEATDGTWAQWDVGDLSTGEGDDIEVTVDIVAGLSPSTTIVITDFIYDHVEDIADYTEITYHILQPPLSLGDLVWNDLNEDGIQDAGEPGVQGVTVALHRTGDCSGSPLDTDTTDANGNYLFTDLSPSTYCLAFDVPAGWEISPQNQGSDDTVDSDVDPTTGQITNINLTDDDLTQDCGIYQPEEPTPEDTPTEEPTEPPDTPTPSPSPSPSPTIEPEPPEVIPEASSLILLGGAFAGLAGYVGLQIRARRRKDD